MATLGLTDFRWQARRKACPVSVDCLVLVVSWVQMFSLQQLSLQMWKPFPCHVGKFIQNPHFSWRSQPPYPLPQPLLKEATENMVNKGDGFPNTVSNPFSFPTSGVQLHPDSSFQKTEIPRISELRILPAHNSLASFCLALFLREKVFSLPARPQGTLLCAFSKFWQQNTAQGGWRMSGPSCLVLRIFPEPPWIHSHVSHVRLSYPAYWPLGLRNNGGYSAK